MKPIDLSVATPSLGELLQLAGKENLLLRTSEGREFVLAELDDFDQEIALVSGNADLMKLLADRAKDKPSLSLDQVRQRLNRDS